LGADPESVAIALGEAAHIHNLSGYTPHTWNEALSQLLGMKAIMGSLMGHTRPDVVDYDQFLRRYIQMLTRLPIHHDLPRPAHIAKLDGGPIGLK
jgi:hypothetical protein